MSRCPITYESISEGRYSRKALHKLSPQLDELLDLPYSVEEQLQEAERRATKMSIQGVQPKLSAKLNVKGKVFEVVDTGGRFILKPQNQRYRCLPENEAITMHLASAVGIDTPFHGMIYAKDGTLTYFIKRFDRRGNRKRALEDFAQLAELSRETKYNYSMERLVPILEQHCTFPKLEKLKLFRLTLFNYLVGNEDAHLKNFSLIRLNHKVELSPAYDLLNTTIVMKGVTEELALPLNGKKRNLNRDIFFNYYAMARLNLTERSINQVDQEFRSSIDSWKSIIEKSFLTEELKQQYWEVISQRRAILKL
jgi:serine/threonine-protein kinase HipA